MNLKYYSVYRKVLIKYAKSLGIKIIFKHVDGDGVWVPSRSYIAIDKELEESDEIAALLHELGHAMDDNMVKTKRSDAYKRLNKAYTAYYKDKHTAKQFRQVKETEKRAWFYGKVIATSLKIRLGRWYTNYCLKCLAAYPKH